MIELIAIPLLSWAILWVYEQSSLLVLGLAPTIRRVADFLFGFLASAGICALGYYLISRLTESTLELNETFTASTLLTGTLWTLKSVLTEEFLFRGALLHIGIKKIGLQYACLASSVLFGIYHWFSYGVWGDIPQMVYTFVLTGVGGYLFAMAFGLTQSMYLPVGLHLGWNLVSIVLFSQGQLGTQILKVTNGQQLTMDATMSFFVYQIAILPIVTYLYLKKRKLQVN